MLKWWQVGLLLLVFFFIGGLAGYLVHKPVIPITPIPHVVLTTGKPDTTHVLPKPIKDHSMAIVRNSRIEKNVSSSASKSFEFGDILYEHTTEGDQNGVHFLVRSTTYPYPDLDSAQVVHEIRIDPLPAETIIRVDTLRIPIPQYVEVPIKPEFFAKPEVAYPLGFIVGVIATIVIVKETK